MRKILNVIFILSSLFVVLACYNDNEYDLYPFAGTTCDSSNVTFSGTVAPIMSANCNSCHSTSVASGNVTTDNYNGLLLIVNDGRLWRDISWEQGSDPMPKGGNQLSFCDRGKIKKWINLGSPNN